MPDTDSCHLAFADTRFTWGHYPAVIGGDELFHQAMHGIRGAQALSEKRSRETRGIRSIRPNGEGALSESQE